MEKITAGRYRGNYRGVIFQVVSTYKPKTKKIVWYFTIKGKKVVNDDDHYLYKRSATKAAFSYIDDLID